MLFIGIKNPQRLEIPMDNAIWGVCYEYGKGVEVDSEKAVYWYSKIRRGWKF